ncbi:PAS domain-containing protein [Thioalkalivibrio sp. ALJ16]|uniref:PAS domain-containing protein n=1 Tax=Thioalkalivibrio sp. ALJ16 TaxID=1158762 RepID=UPI00036266DE|nr:PAS domain-containing protein [Thioalkalivibrio sp. ALJ16]
MSEICAIHGYAALFDYAPVGLAEMDTEGRILRANASLAALLGCATADLVDAPLQAHVFPEDRAYCQSRRQVLLQGGCDHCHFELRLLDPDGQPRWVEITSSRIPATADCAEAILVVIADIAARKAAEQRAETLLRASPAVIYTMSPDNLGVMTWMSPNAETVTGWTPDQVTGEPDWLATHVPAEDYRRSFAQIQRWLAEGGQGVCHLSYRQRRSDGRWQWLEDQVTAIRDAQGAVVELVGAFQDVGARLETERHLEKIAHNLPGVIYQYQQYPDGRGLFPYASEGMTEVYGVTPEAVMRDASSVFEVIHPDDVDLVVASIEASMRSLEPWRQRYRVRHPERGEIWLEGHASPEAMDDGSVLWHGVLLDITERVRAEEALHQREQELAEAQRIAHVGNWVSDFVRNEIRGSDEVFRIFGIRRGEWPGTHEAFLQTVHPEDRERVQGEINAALAGNGCFDSVHRVLRPDGRERVVHERGYVEFDDHGRALRMAGTVQDITDRHRMEQEQRLLAATFDSSQAIFITDAEGTIQRVNATFTELTGFTDADAVGSNPRIMNSGCQEPAFYEEMFRTVRERGHWSGEVWNRRKDGRIFPLHEIVTAIRDTEGAIDYYIAVFHDISRQKELEAALEHQAFYDPLTDAANRGHFEAVLEQEAQRAQRYQQPCSLVMLDLDHFKRINDTHGHDVGDEVLRRVVHASRERLRGTDVLGRWGGEEFMVLLPGTDAEAAARVAEDLRRQVAALDFERVGRVTISLGVAQCQRGEAIKDWIKRADDAMYAAKREGRNQVQPAPAPDAPDAHGI